MKKQLNNIIIDPETLWFNTIIPATLCKNGGNGSQHPSQIYAINKYVKSGMSLLDYGSGSATTYEALILNGWKVYSKTTQSTIRGEKDIIYKGIDVIPKFTEYCKQTYPQVDFEINLTLHKIDQLDKSWDVVYSRHVVDHMESFEGALDEHCRVAKKLVIIVLWVPPGDMPEHQIKHIIDQGKVYKDEYTNQYSKPLIMKALKEKEQEGWKLEEYTEEVGVEVKGHDVVIVLSHE